MANKREAAKVVASARSERVLNPENVKTIERPGVSEGTTERQYMPADAPAEPPKVEIERRSEKTGTREIIRLHPDASAVKGREE